MEIEITMQYERGFKLVSVADNNTYWSWRAPILGTVEYKIGEWTVPLKGNGPLAVFDNVDNLLRFCVLTRWHACRAFEVEHIRSTKRALWINPEYIRPPERYIPVTEKIPGFFLPAGTVFASQVRLLREIIFDSKAHTI